MNCTRAKRELELMREQNSGDLLNHLRRCADCREHAEELRVVRLLRSMPAPEPSPGFEQRALQAVVSRPRGEVQARVRGWQLATAASLLLVVMLAIPRGQPPETSVPSVAAVQSGAPLPVSVSLDSGRRLEGAVIRVSLPAHLSLEGYPGVRELEWQTNLNAGGNRLTLPVQLQGAAEDGGEIQIEVEHRGARKVFRVPVRPRPAGQTAADAIHRI